MKRLSYSKTCKKWDVFEITIKGPAEGNPFIEQSLSGEFRNENESIKVNGFYDGDGVYRIRMMPSFEGEYTFKIKTSFGMLEEGSFLVTAADEENHGPVHVANQFHMKYADNTPYYSIGTTCYVWELQLDERIEETLQTLNENAFNKLRFCIFPKHYDYNTGEPRDYPYEGTPVDSSDITAENFWDYTGKTEGNHWDFTRFRPGYFQHIEACIKKLADMGIEADLILMHPYDRWGFSCMDKESDDRYLRYVTARFSAYHNVWWSLANEYDLMPAKTEADWERFAQIIKEEDPYHHMCSIHNCAKHYDYSRAWVTHCSVQRTDLYKSSEMVDEWRERYQKPVVMDEIAYEGNIQHGWGNITGEEMVRRFWEAACRGGYPGHGETYMNEERILWWSHGGKLHGESHKRVAFLLDIMKETPGCGLMPYKKNWDDVCAVPEENDGSYYLYYYSFMRPSYREFNMPEKETWQVTVIDTWNMTKEIVGEFQGKFKVALPGRQYMAIQLKRK